MELDFEAVNRVKFGEERCWTTLHEGDEGFSVETEEQKEGVLGRGNANVKEFRKKLVIRTPFGGLFTNVIKTTCACFSPLILRRVRAVTVMMIAAKNEEIIPQARRRTSDNREHCPLRSTRKPLRGYHQETARGDLRNTCHEPRNSWFGKGGEGPKISNHSTKPFHMDGMMKWN